MTTYLRQSTAAQDRTIGPFVDDTDYKTPETGLTIANTDIKLIKNGAAVVNKNSGGATHRSTGEYGITLDATDTNTVGELEAVINVAGALVVWKTWWVLEEAIYDALFGASAAGFDANQDVTVGGYVAGQAPLQPTVAGRTLDVTATGAGGIDWGNLENPTTANNLSATNIDPDQVVASVTAGVSVTTNNDKTGYTLSSAGIQALWDFATSLLTTVGSIGKLLVDNINATISSRLATAGYTAPDNATISTINTKIGTPAVDLATDIAAKPTANQNADALLDRANAIETGFTLRQVMRLLGTSAGGTRTGFDTNSPQIAALDGSKIRISSVDATVDGNATVTTDVT